MDDLFNSSIENILENVDRYEVFIITTADTDNKKNILTNGTEIRIIDDMVMTYKSIGIRARIYTDVKVFYNDLASFKNCKFNREPIVISRAVFGSGPEAKSVIPSICKFFGTKYAGANAYTGALMRHKFHYSLLLNSLGILVPKSWLFCNDNGWLEVPPLGIEVIAKPIHLSDSKGILNHNKFCYSDKADFFVKNLSHMYSEPIILQEFIEGYEINIPLIIVNNKIISSVIGVGIDESRDIKGQFFSCEFDYSKRFFYDFNEVSKVVTKKALSIANKIVKLLKLNGVYRIDARIDNDLNIYINDINSSPGISKSSSFDYFIKQHGITQKEFYLLILASATN